MDTLIGGNSVSHSLFLDIREALPLLFHIDRLKGLASLKDITLCCMDDSITFGKEVRNCIFDESSVPTDLLS
jgi:predicted helicase